MSRAAKVIGRLEEEWMCKSTVLLVRAADLGVFGSDVLLYWSQRLRRSVEYRFRVYVDRANAQHRAETEDERAASAPASGPEFSDPQHGGEEPPVEWTAEDYDYARRSEYCPQHGFRISQYAVDRGIEYRTPCCDHRWVEAG